MEIKIKDLKTLIQEEFMRGVPEFELQEATHNYIQQIKNRVKKHIEQTSNSPSQAREKHVAMSEVFAELESDVNDLLEDKIWSFMQRT